MLKNYLLIALRNLNRQKVYSFINITGLAIGMACSILILLWVQDELSYDRFHKNAENLYRVEQDQNYSGELYHVNITPYPMAPALKEEIPEVVAATRLVWTGGLLFQHGEKVFFETGVVGVDPSFFDMFTFPFVSGDINTALVEPLSIVITEELADKYFAGEEPLGKVLTVNNTYELKVTGVIKNIPDNSSSRFDIVLPYELLKVAGMTSDSWGRNEVLTFVQLRENSSIPVVNEKISALRHKYLTGGVQDRNPENRDKLNRDSRVEFSVRLLTDIHLFAYFGFGEPLGEILYVYIFSVIALFILLIACINFMNLATARSANRAKEIGMRKVVGALKRHIVIQFFSESIIFTFIALFFSLVLVELFLPLFNTLSGKELLLDIVGNWNFLLGLIAITLFTGIVAGSYPALFLSAFKPVSVLKGSLKSGIKRSALRKVLVVVQFTISILLIVGAIVVYNQLDYMKNKKLGYKKEQLLYIRLRGDSRQLYSKFKSELIKDSRILGVTGTSQRPSGISSNSNGAEWDGKDPDQDILIGFNFVDFDFTETLKIEIADGRSFSKDFATDTSTAFLVNEKVVKIMGVESAVGENFSFMGRKGKIVGVMKDFHYKSVRETIESIALLISPSNIGYTLIKIQPGDISSALNFIKSTWESVIPDYPFNYNFLDEDFDSMYHAEDRMGDLLKYFSVIAILIACLGLFSLVSFMAEQRTKEIGIRKVLGASVSGIVTLLSKDFVKLVPLANLIAWPIAWYAMNKWLQNFAYRIDVGWWVFILAGGLALLIALLTVSILSMKAALANPVESLRYE